MENTIQCTVTVFFTSVALFDVCWRMAYMHVEHWKLTEKDTQRNLKNIFKKGLGERGKSIQIKDGNMVFSLWQDNKLVTMLSTNCEKGERNVQRKQKNGSRNTLSCPLNIIKYNWFMGGVDRTDQLRKYYTIRLKSRKVYKYVFRFLFEVVLVNTYILSRYVPSTDHCNRHYIDFRVALADQLIGDYNSKKRRGRPSSSTPILSCLLLLTEHFPMQAEKEAEKEADVIIAITQIK